MDREIEMDALVARVRAQQAEIESLKEKLEQRIAPISGTDGYRSFDQPLRPDEYKRYGRQMILPQIGLQGQLRLRNAAVLIVGLGGLGCPAAAYLVGAGIGTLGLMDGDVVELSNLHRQILHSSARIGMLKVESAAANLRLMNPLVQLRVHPYDLTSTSAVADFSLYDIILDCTDNPMSRYLVSDAAVCARKPFISAAALRTDGQLYVLNHPSFDPEEDENYPSGPCYRCVHPKPPPVETIVSCGEGGILGPVVGTMGTLMASEAIKIIISQDDRHKMAEEEHFMLIYSAYATPPFRSIKIKGRRQDCIACSPFITSRLIEKKLLTSGHFDYSSFCGQAEAEQMISSDARMSATEFYSRWRKLRHTGRIVLIDTRDRTQFGICNILGSTNVPIDTIKGQTDAIADRVRQQHAEYLVAVCRFGNDSQRAACHLRSTMQSKFEHLWVGDIEGGLEAWKREVDETFPEY